MLTLVPVPGQGAGQLTPEGNLAGYVDRLLFTTDHIWRHGKDAAGNIVYDPEGLLSTLGALGNVLLGAAAAIWWRRAGDRALRGIAIASVVLIAIALAMSGILPFNKRLWTSSFALLTSGLSGLLFVAAVAGRQEQCRALRHPVPHPRRKRTDGLLPVAADRHRRPARDHPRRRKLGDDPRMDLRADRLAVGAPMFSSAIYGLLVLAVTFALVAPLHRRGLHLRL